MFAIEAIQIMWFSPEMAVAVWGSATCFLVSVAIILTKNLHGSATLDLSVGIQKFHTAPTPRIGGVPIFIGLLISWSKAAPEIKQLLVPILIAGLPAFFFGFAEDITKKVGVIARLLATMASGFLAWWITDYSISRVDIPVFDMLLKYIFFSVLFTAFSAGGIANAINIIDGFNGLAGTMTMLALIALSVGDNSLAMVAIILAASVWGFLLVNWPLGKLFLGDGGSYFVGFSLAWVAVLLIERNPSVSAFAALLICVHPVSEVLLSIFRRKVKKLNPGYPDRLHFHSLVHQRYVRHWFCNLGLELRNSITGLFVGVMTLTSVLIALLVYKSALLSFAAVIFLMIIYVAIYARMVRFKWSSPLSFLMNRPNLSDVHTVQK